MQAQSIKNSVEFIIHWSQDLDIRLRTASVNNTNIN